ncbi:hypothetical protein, partial [Neobacillus bataviensis]|uniref:hypothetical protein n=1 Tax=Neobacillus bataviensis TaxID=220685 RepID=UPI00058D6776
MKKKLSFLSGLAAAALFLFPFATNTYAAETNPTVETVEESSNLTDTIYLEEVPGDVYYEDV